MQKIIIDRLTILVLNLLVMIFGFITLFAISWFSSQVWLWYNLPGALTTAQIFVLVTLYRLVTLKVTTPVELKTMDEEIEEMSDTVYKGFVRVVAAALMTGILSLLHPWLV